MGRNSYEWEGEPCDVCGEPAERWYVYVPLCRSVWCAHTIDVEIEESDNKENE